jgi:hypothetical protein
MWFVNGFVHGRLLTLLTPCFACAVRPPSSGVATSRLSGAAAGKHTFVAGGCLSAINCR